MKPKLDGVSTIYGFGFSSFIRSVTVLETDAKHCTFIAACTEDHSHKYLIINSTNKLQGRSDTINLCCFAAKFDLLTLMRMFNNYGFINYSS